LPRSLAEPLQREIERARVIHAGDLAAGFGATRLPHALARKYPRAAREFGWQFVFPSVQRAADPLDGTLRRHHFDDAILARAMKSARLRAGIDKPLSAHTLRHSFVDAPHRDGLRHSHRARAVGPPGRVHHGRHCASVRSRHWRIHVRQ
ncbi:integron integrase, partial [mine drainage metagenome]